MQRSEGFRGQPLNSDTYGGSHSTIGIDEVRAAKSVTCPHCGVVLDPAPSRKRKCPECRALIEVRTRKTDGVRLLLTPAQALEFDEDRDGIESRNRALRFARSIGASEADFTRTERDLIKQRNSGAPADIFCAIANDRARQALQRHEWDKLYSIYWGQARFLYEEGRPHFQLLHEAVRAKLTGYLHSGGVQRVVVLTGGQDTCPNCARLEGTVFTIPEALDMMPIPNPACEHDWCRCTWAPVAR